VTPVQALFVFGGIPLAFSALVAVLVYASSWTRSGRVSADYDAGPFLVASDPAMPDPSRLPSELASGSDSSVGGGVSARW
jgi:hypothetical protein